MEPIVIVLLLSVISLFIGPLLYQWLRRGGMIAKAFDTLIVAVLVVLIGLLLVPEVYGRLGTWSLALILSGYLAPGLLENLLKKAAHTFHLISLLLALAGLALHAMLDGAGLTGGQDQVNNLALAIVLHRFGVGLMLWMMVQPVFGRRAAFAVLVFVALATIAGFLLSEHIPGLTGDRAMSVIQSLIIGTIVHSLVHRSHGRSQHA